MTLWEGVKRPPLHEALRPNSLRSPSSPKVARHIDRGAWHEGLGRSRPTPTLLDPPMTLHGRQVMCGLVIPLPYAVHKRWLRSTPPHLAKRRARAHRRGPRRRTGARPARHAARAPMAWIRARATPDDATARTTKAAKRKTLPQASRADWAGCCEPPTTLLGACLCPPSWSLRRGPGPAGGSATTSTGSTPALPMTHQQDTKRWLHTGACVTDGVCARLPT